MSGPQFRNPPRRPQLQIYFGKMKPLQSDVREVLIAGQAKALRGGAGVWKGEGGGGGGAVRDLKLQVFLPQSRQSAKLFLQSLELGLPSPARECALPPFGSGGRGTLAAERGGGRVPIPTRGHTLWYSLYVCTL